MQPVFKSNSLFAQRLIAILALVILALALGASAYREHGDLVNLESERMQMQARVIQHNAEQNLRALNSALTDTLKHDASARTLTNLDMYLTAVSDGMPSVRTLSIVDRNGRMLVSSRAELIGLDFSGRDYFVAARRKPDPATLYISEPFQTILGVRTINVSRLRQGRDGGFNGVVTATLDPSYFSPLLDSIRYAPDMTVSLVHANGAGFLTLPLKNAPSEARLFGRDGVLDRHLRSRRDISLLPDVDYGDGDRMAVLVTIAPAALGMDNPLVVVMDRDRMAILARWRRDVRIFGGLYALIVLASMSMLLRYQRRLQRADARTADAIRALQEREHFMKTVTDHLPAMMAYWDRDLHCRFANGSYFEWFGRTPEQMKGIHIRELLGDRLFNMNEPFIRGSLRGEKQRFERTLTKPDGSIGYTWAQYIPDAVDGRVLGFFVLVSDVTPLKKAQMALAESEWKLRTIVETEPECVAILTSEGEVEQLNPAGVKMFGFQSEGLACGIRLMTMVAPRYRQAFDNMISDVGRGISGELTFELGDQNGGRRWLECHAVPMSNRQQQVAGSLCVMRDVTERKKAEEQLAYLAQTDSLTELSNRRHFMSQAEQEIARARRYGGALTILMMDIDHFKKINDTYGHKTGDVVIRKFADLCRNTLRSPDIVGRIGGEEFAVVLPETDRGHALQVAELLRHRVENAELESERRESVRFTVSVGLASRNDGEWADLETLLAEADAALYQAKNGGRNRVCEYRMGIRLLELAT